MGKQEYSKSLAVKEYTEGNSITYIAKKYKVDRHRVSSDLKSQGVEVSRTSSRYKYSEDYFREIDSEEKAYWLGFLFADGYVSEKDHKLELGLGIKDISHVEKFRDTIVPTKPIQLREKVNGCRLSCTNKNLVVHLVSKGLTGNKSLTKTFPQEETLTAQLVRHFLRGYFDGNGSISQSTRGIMACWSCGSDEFIKEIQTILSRETGITNSVYKVKDSNCYSLNLGGSSAIKVLDYLYEDCNLFLDRKYDTYCRLTSKLHEK